MELGHTTHYGEYVRFMKGTPTAWKNVEGRADQGTLYFIAEPGAATGSLYLGNMLITSGESQTLNTILGIEDDIPNNSLLIYDKENDTWDVVSPGKLIGEYLEPMEGATETDAGSSGLVPMAPAGGNNLFLKGDGTWSKAEDERVDAVLEITEQHDDLIKALLEKYELLEGGDIQLNLVWGNF